MSEIDELILRESMDGNIRVIERILRSQIVYYVIVNSADNNHIEFTSIAYERKTEAFRKFGKLTRNNNEK